MQKDAIIWHFNRRGLQSAQIPSPWHSPYRSPASIEILRSGNALSHFLYMEERRSPAPYCTAVWIFFRRDPSQMFRALTRIAVVELELVVSDARLHGVQCLIEMSTENARRCAARTDAFRQARHRRLMDDGRHLKTESPAISVSGQVRNNKIQYNTRQRHITLI